MIINTDFHSYYDTLAKQNMDSTVVYNRYSQKCDIEFERYSKYVYSTSPESFTCVAEFVNSATQRVRVTVPAICNSLLRSHIRVGGVGCSSAVLLFCGVPYFGFLKNKATTPLKNILFYNPDNTSLSDAYRDDISRYVSARDYASQFDFSQLHHDLESPVILLGGSVGCRIVGNEYGLSFNPGVLHINPNLDGLKFFKVLDSWRTYDKLYSYLSGVLNLNQKPLIEVSDVDKLTGHGFDTKISFRHPVK